MKKKRGKAIDVPGLEDMLPNVGPAKLARPIFRLSIQRKRKPEPLYPCSVCGKRPKPNTIALQHPSWRCDECAKVKP
jgi:hypothetical protein